MSETVDLTVDEEDLLTSLASGDCVLTECGDRWHLSRFRSAPGLQTGVRCVSAAGRALLERGLIEVSRVQELPGETATVTVNHYRVTGQDEPEHPESLPDWARVDQLVMWPASGRKPWRITQVRVTGYLTIWRSLGAESRYETMHADRLRPVDAFDSMLSLMQLAHGLGWRPGNGFDELVESLLLSAEGIRRRSPEEFQWRARQFGYWAMAWLNENTAIGLTWELNPDSGEIRAVPSAK